MRFQITHDASSECLQVLCGERTALQEEAHHIWFQLLEDIGAHPISQSVKNNSVCIQIEGGSINKIKEIYFNSRFEKFLKNEFGIDWATHNFNVFEIDTLNIQSEYINYKFKIRLLKGDLNEWKSYDAEIKKLVYSDPYFAKNLKIKYKGRIRFVSVDYKSETIQTQGILAVRDFFIKKGFVQENIDTKSSIQMDKNKCQKTLKSMQSILKTAKTSA